MNNTIYKKVMDFKRRYPITIGWRTNEHCRILEEHLGDDEEVIYAFTAQKNDSHFNIITTCVVAITNKRLIIGQKRVVFGYFFYSITPDLFNDLQIKMGIIWGKIYIDTVKEVVILSNISKGALIEIEEAISSFMIEEKKKYPLRSHVKE